MVLRAIQIAFGPFVFTGIVRSLTVSGLYCSVDCHPALHVHFGAQRGQPLFRLIDSVTLEGRNGKPGGEGKTWGSCEAGRRNEGDWEPF